MKIATGSLALTLALCCALAHDAHGQVGGPVTPNTRAAIQALYGNHISGKLGPFVRQAKRIDRDGARMGLFAMAESGPHSLSRSGAKRVIKLRQTPETLTVSPGRKQSFSWYLHTEPRLFGSGKSTQNLVFAHTYLAGQRTSKLLRKAGARTKPGDQIRVETIFDLETGGVTRRAWLPGLNRFDLPAPLWAKKMAKKLPRLEPASN